VGWNILKQEEAEELKAEDYWHKPEEIVQKSGLKVLMYGEPEVGNVCQALDNPG